MLRAVVFGVVVGAALSGASATAQQSSLRQDGDSFWVGLASGHSRDEAIGLAQTFSIKPFMVVSSANGWYAAVTGPYHVPAGTGQSFLEKLRKDKGASPDAYLTRGAHYGEVVWTPPKDHVEASLDYDGEHDAELDRGDLRLVMSRRSDGKDAFAPTLAAFYKGRRAFRLDIDDNSNEKPAAAARLIRLDASSPLPSVVFTYFWQGAHCCTLTKIATLKNDGSWAVVNSGPLDSEGYEFEDLDGAGRSLLVSVDQNFLYTFASYAGSYAPLKIEKLEGGQIVDVTHEPAMKPFVAQDMYRQRALAKQNEPASEVNGYLASFVAESMVIGDGHAAWQTMLNRYDRTNEDGAFGIDKCSIDVALDKCPDDKKTKMSLPEGLRQFLVEHGYMTDPDSYPVPSLPASRPQNVAFPVAPPAPVSPPPQADTTPPQLQECAGATETVRKLIYQQFAGREATSDEPLGDVTVEDDQTLEGYDSNIQKVTCAVSYSFAPRALIGRLAEDGNMMRAATLGRMSRQRGGTITGRVRFTVKPTARTGTSWIELLP